MDVTLEQEGVSDENMCNGHGTHSLTSVLSRQRGTRRVTVQHLREDAMLLYGWAAVTLLYVCNGGSRDTGRVTIRCHRWLPRLSSVLSILYRVP